MPDEYESLHRPLSWDPEPEDATRAQRVGAMIEMMSGATTIFNFGGIVVLWLPGEPELACVVTSEALELRYEVKEWPSHFAVRSTHLWKRFPLEEVYWDERRLRKVLQDARRARIRQFKPCRFCGKDTPVEEREQGACYGCQEKHLGIIF